MKWQHSDRSKQDYDRLEPKIQKAFDKQVRLLGTTCSTPPLHAKKYDESQDLWQARVNRAWRFYFQIDKDTLIIVRIVPPPQVIDVYLGFDR